MSNDIANLGVRAADLDDVLELFGLGVDGVVQRLQLRQ